MIHYCLTLTIFLAPLMTRGQQPSGTNGAADGRWDPATGLVLSKWCIREYIIRCSLLNDTFGIVNGNSIKRFEQLFMHNAEVVDDLSKSPGSQLINYRDYASMAHTWLNKTGIKSSFSEIPGDNNTDPVQYRLIELGSRSVYRYELNVTKQVYQEIDSSGQVTVLEWGKTYPLLFVLYYFPDNSEIFISDIWLAENRRPKRR